VKSTSNLGLRINLLKSTHHAANHEDVYKLMHVPGIYHTDAATNNSLVITVTVTWELKLRYVLVNESQ
jgi:hypothetical protein